MDFLPSLKQAPGGAMPDADPVSFAHRVKIGGTRVRLVEPDHALVQEPLQESHLVGVGGESVVAIGRLAENRPACEIPLLRGFQAARIRFYAGIDEAL